MEESKRAKSRKSINADYYQRAKDELKAKREAKAEKLERRRKQKRDWWNRNRAVQRIEDV